MPDPVPTAQGKIIEALRVLIEGYPTLGDEPVYANRAPEDAISHDDIPSILIFAGSWEFEDDEMQGQTLHDLLVYIERIETSANVGLVSAVNQEKIAHVVAALHSDPELGGRAQRVQPLNVAPPMDNIKSIAGASLQVRVQFYTPLGDHFTIAGMGGETF